MGVSGEEAQEGGDTCILTADSCCWTEGDLDLALGLRSSGRWVCLLLFVEGVVCEWEAFKNAPQEQVHLSIWPAMFN